MKIVKLVGKGKPILHQNLSPQLLNYSGIVRYNSCERWNCCDLIFFFFLKEKNKLLILSLDKDLAMKYLEDNLFSMVNSVYKTDYRMEPNLCQRYG